MSSRCRLGLMVNIVPQPIWRLFHCHINAHIEVRKMAKIRNRYNQAPHLIQDTNEKVTTSQSDITNERAKRSVLFQQETTRHFITYYCQSTPNGRNGMGLKNLLFWYHFKPWIVILVRKTFKYLVGMFKWTSALYFCTYRICDQQSLHSSNTHSRCSQKEWINLLFHACFKVLHLLYFLS